MAGRLRLLGMALVLVILGASLYASADDVAGRWDVSIKGTGAHGEMTAVLVLEQDGTKVKGTLSAHGREHAVAGTFADSKLSLQTDAPAGRAVELTGKLLADGTLSGVASTPDGDMKWTAARVKGVQ